MAIKNRVNRRNSTELKDVKGVNFDVEKIKKGLSSEVIDVPKHQSIEETATWLSEMIEKRKIKA
jgi:regulator of PEP synthase PpsR (kinase-PPPase family)